MGPYMKISFSDRNAALTDQELIYIHHIYSETDKKLAFIVATKQMMISLMHYLKAAQLRDVEKTIEAGFKWTL